MEQLIHLELVAVFFGRQVEVVREIYDSESCGSLGVQGDEFQWIKAQRGWLMIGRIKPE